MKHKLLLAIALLFAFYSCDNDPLSLNNLDQVPSIEVEEMVASGLTKTIVFKKSTGTMTPVDVDPDVCDGVAQVLVQGTGIATHLGKFTVENIICIHEASPPMITGVLTAANGDQIFTYVSGGWKDGDISYYVYTIYNGSGRFEGITGELLMYGIVDETNGTFDLQGEGTFTYP